MSEPDENLSIHESFLNYNCINKYSSRTLTLIKNKNKKQKFSVTVSKRKPKTIVDYFAQPSCSKKITKCKNMSD
jgi:hypothetical protein